MSSWLRRLAERYSPQPILQHLQPINSLRIAEGSSVLITLDLQNHILSSIMLNDASPTPPSPPAALPTVPCTGSLLLRDPPVFSALDYMDVDDLISPYEWCVSTTNGTTKLSSLRLNPCVRRGLAVGYKPQNGPSYVIMSKRSFTQNIQWPEVCRHRTEQRFCTRSQKPEVTSSDAGNCCRDVVSILNMSSAVSLAESPTAVTSHRRSSLLEPVDDEHDYTHRVDLPQSLSAVTSAVVPYIAGFVARKKARLQAYGAQRRHKAVAAPFCPEQYGRRRVSAASLRYMGGYAGPPLQKF
ncbi:hypothetical protein HPB51_010375 [Rhipicephalus microplus]|uniref:Uncharacterized protein n=1 Tax=Rhipicephalus microplus TaxID=6941 RepID=A0A9J6EGG7_RHIMP|nr:hypothetical protein HPB51_010375 [Rhipicephalus microplus]